MFTLEGHQYAVRRIKVGTALKPVSWEGKGIVGLNATPLFFKTVILSLTSVATMVRGKHAFQCLNIEEGDQVGDLCSAVVQCFYSLVCNFPQQ